MINFFNDIKVSTVFFSNDLHITSGISPLGLDLSINDTCEVSSEIFVITYPLK